MSSATIKRREGRPSLITVTEGDAKTYYDASNISVMPSDGRYNISFTVTTVIRGNTRIISKSIIVDEYSYL